MKTDPGISNGRIGNKYINSVVMGKEVTRMSGLSILEPAKRDPATMRIHIEDPFAATKLADELYRQLSAVRLENGDRPVVILCIGTDRSTGDALGPLVGSRLARSSGRMFTVHGTLDEPVHATNLKQVMADIKTRYDHPFIIAIDACLGYPDNVGCVNLGAGPLKPGAGVKKSLPAVGEMHITGVVNVGGFMEYMILQNTRLSKVMRIADVIAAGVEQSMATHRQAAVTVEQR